MPLISISHLGGTLSARYALTALADLWTEMGLDVAVANGFSPEADLAILHHDRTRLDPAKLPPAPPGVRVVNGGVLDISKRRYSSLLLQKGDPWDGPVIVKTDLNSFGAPERSHLRNRPLDRAHRYLAEFNWKLARRLPKPDYPVLSSIREVPGWVWGRDDLIVERFLPEREGDLYCLRGWLFFGPAGYGYRLYATDPTVKTGSMVRYDYLDEVPPEIEEHRREMQFDFGKFDYVVHDGRAILLDANKTPAFAGDRRSENLMRLARGIEAFLP